MSRAAHAFALALAALLVPTVPAFAATPARGSDARPAVRDATSLPSLQFSNRPSRPIGAGFVTETDSFLVRSYAFQTTAGACLPGAWIAEDRTNTVYAHVSNRVVNRDAAFGIPGTVNLAMPRPITGGRLRLPLTCTVDDSGHVVVFSDDQSATMIAQPGFVVYPEANLLRRFDEGTQDFRWSAFDPATRTVIVSDAVFLRRFPQGGGLSTIIAGTGGITDEDTTVAFARIYPGPVATDAAGNIYFTEPIQHRVRMLRIDGRVVTLAGTFGVPGFSGDGGPASLAQLFLPQGIAVDPAGTKLYISDTQNHRVRVIDLFTGTINTLFGDGSSLTLQSPADLAFSNGWIYMTAEVLPGGRQVLRSDGLAPPSLVYGATTHYQPPAESTLGRHVPVGQPSGLAADGLGGIYLCDPRHGVVWHLFEDTTIAPLAGVTVPVLMGDQAVWVGADAVSAPDEVAHWVTPAGHGNGWSQRLTSPVIDYASHPNAVLTFDFALGLAGFSGSSEVIAVQGLTDDGTWASLRTRVTALGHPFNLIHDGNPPDPDSPRFYMGGTGTGRIEVRLGEDGNEVVGLADATRLRVVVNTQPFNSNEDGFETVHAGAAAIDNLRVTDGAADVIAPLDCEDGTTGAWTLSAFNHMVEDLGFYAFDFPPPATTPALRTGFDFSDPSCAWTFVDATNQVPTGALQRLTSPWIPLADPHRGFLISFSGKLTPEFQGRLVRVMVRSRLTGDVNPRGLTQGQFRLQSGVTGTDDNAVPFVDQRVIRYPDDFQFPIGGESHEVQIVLQVEDTGGEVEGAPLPGRPPTRLPYLDDIRVWQEDVDQDFDGVPDLADACATVCAAGQDADGDGCPDPTATMRHVESWDGAQALTFQIAEGADPTIGDASDVEAIEAGILEWTTVPGAAATVTVVPAPAGLQNAAALDRLNLVTFQDPDFVFPGNVVAVTPTTSFTRRLPVDDEVVLPGRIVDSDMIFNRAQRFSTATVDGGPESLDLRSVTTHEAGHFFGLTHSGVLDASMFFVIQPGEDAASLEHDDHAAIAAAYPGATLGTDFATVRGTVIRGATSQPIPGALVTAVRLDVAGAPADSVASDYSAEDGSYALFRLPPGDYGVRVTPLDGNVGGTPLTPGFISERLAASAQTNFQPEWWSDPEHDRDDPTIIGTLTLAAGETRAAIGIVTNVDTIPPAIVRVTPPADTTNVRIDAAIVVTFSEPIEITTIPLAFRVHPAGDTARIGGQGLLLSNGTTFVFTPDDPLLFGTVYAIDFTTALTDREGVPLAAAFTSAFTTQPATPVTIADIQPRAAAAGGLIAILGSGFDADDPLQNVVEFQICVPCESPPVIPSQVTPTSMIVRVPTDAVSGPVRVVVGGVSTSNEFDFTVLPPPSQVSPAPLGEPVALDFAPTDVAFAPDGVTVYAVGAAGMATINLDPNRANFRVPVSHPVGDASHVVLSPDGFTAYVSRPSDGLIALVDADPLSGTFGAVLRSVALPGDAEPRGLALSPNGRRLYATDAIGRRVLEIDVDPASASRDEVLRELEDTTAVFTNGIAVSRAGDQIVYTSVLPGGRRRAIEGPVGDAATISGSSSDAVAAHPGNVEYVLTNRPGRLRFYRPQLPAVPDLVLGGEPRDVVFTPVGQSALVTNGAFNLLQVISTDPALPSYHTKVAEVATGVNPVALALSGDGSLGAVACFGSRDIRLYTMGGGVAIERLVRTVATPGAAVAVQASNTDEFSGGTQVDLSGAPFDPTNVVGVGVAFRVPASPQRDATVTLVTPQGDRSIGLPLRIVDPIPSFVAKATARVLQNGPAACSPDSAPQMHMRTRVSPDGRVLANLWRDQALGDCYTLELFRISADGAEVFGQRIASLGGIDFPSIDFEFTPDSRHIWATASLGGAVQIIDASPESPTLGTVVGGFGIGTDQLTYLASDPLGRFMAVANGITNQIHLYSPAGLAAGTLSRSTTAHVWSMTISPDGRWLIAGLEGRMEIFDLNTRASVALTPDYGGDEFDATMVGVTADGRRAIGRFNFNTLTVNNLDPADGAVGAELAVTNAATRNLVGNLVPAPNGTAVVSALTSSAELLRIDTATNPPTITATSVGQPSTTVVTTADGRYAVFGPTSIEGLPGPLQVRALGEGTTLALVSGGGQSAQGGELLPFPVRVKVTDSDARAQAGVAIVFTVPAGAAHVLDELPGRNVVHRFTDANGEAQVTWRIPPASPTFVHAMNVAALGIGNPLVVNATTAGSDAEIPPVLVALGPPTGAIDINAGTAVFARFNQPMDSLSVTAAFHLAAFGQPVTGTFDLEDGGRLVLFQPAQPLPFAAPCELRIDAGALDTDGQSLVQGATSLFTVQLEPALALHTVTPPAAAPGAPVVIAGQGFRIVPAQNVVLFNGLAATVAAASPTELVVNVPLEALTGDVVVLIGPTTSNAVHFNVLGGTGVGGVIGQVDVGGGARDIAVTPDGTRAYVTNPSTSTVTALDILNVTTITNVGVGTGPRGIAILPDGSRAYVANAGSGSVSVIDVSPLSPTYHQVVNTITTCSEPVDVAIAPIGPEVLIVCAGDSGSLQIIDATPGNATFDQVVRTISTGGGGVGVAVSPDGTRAYVLGEDGTVAIVDLALDAVVRTVSAGGGGQGVAIRPDGTLLFVLLTSGQVAIIDLVPGSPTENQVVRTVSPGGGGQGIGVSPDGGLLYITNGDGNTIAVFEIVTGGGSGSTSITPGPPVDLQLVATIPVGDNPVGLAADPRGTGLLLVVNAGSGTVTFIGDPTLVGAIEVEFEFGFNILDMKVFGEPFVRAFFEVPPPYTLADIVVPSVRLQNVVPSLDTEGKIADWDDDGIPNLELKFSRDHLRLVLPEGDKVPVHATGRLGDRRFHGVDELRVVHATIVAPAAGAVLHPGEDFVVQWITPENVHPIWIALLLSTNGGRTWSIEGRDLPTGDTFLWNVPPLPTDSAKIAIVLAEEDGPHEGEVIGVLGTSDLFRIGGTVTGVDAAPSHLSFAPVRPNPAAGETSLRFGLPRASAVRLEVFDLQGRRVSRLVDGTRPAGWHDVRWDGTNERGAPVNAGLYLVRFRAEGRSFEQRLVWLR